MKKLLIIICVFSFSSIAAANPLLKAAKYGKKLADDIPASRARHAVDDVAEERKSEILKGIHNYRLSSGPKDQIEGHRIFLTKDKRFYEHVDEDSGKIFRIPADEVMVDAKLAELPVAKIKFIDGNTFEVTHANKFRSTKVNEPPFRKTRYSVKEIGGHRVRFKESQITEVIEVIQDGAHKRTFRKRTEIKFDPETNQFTRINTTQELGKIPKEEVAVNHFKDKDGKDLSGIFSAHQSKDKTRFYVFTSNNGKIEQHVFNISPGGSNKALAKAEVVDSLKLLDELGVDVQAISDMEGPVRVIGENSNVGGMSFGIK
jgi:hypothetical protein